MQTTKNTTARQLLLFYEDLQNKELITKSEESVYGSYCPRLWYFIFLHVFDKNPVDPKDKPVQGKQPLGSNDPNWDVLFNQKQAFKAQELVLRLLRRRKHLVVKQGKEKAA